MVEKSFQAQVSERISAYRDRLKATFRSSAQDVARGITLPVAKGGHMRVDTGFLRASLMASTSQMPRINPMARPDAGQSYDENLEPVIMTIAQAELNETIYLGFTASYAGIREYHDGFVRLTAQRWQQIVAENARKAIKAFP